MKKILIIITLLFTTNNVISQCVSGDCTNGYGKFQYNDAVYEGYWKDSKFEGIGILIYNNGIYYFGEFVNNQFHGYGAMHLKNGDNYTGQWQNGKQHGIGTFKSPTKNQNYAGNWKEGQFATPIPTDAPANNPSDCIAGNCMDGFGRMTEGKETIEAIFKNGKAIFGKIGNRNQVYEGNIANNQANGYGQIKYANGDHYFGYFKDDLRHGKGILTKKDATRMHGSWENGVWKFEFNATASCNELISYLSLSYKERHALKTDGFTADIKKAVLKQKFLNHFEVQTTADSTFILFPEDKEGVPTVTQETLIKGLKFCENFKAGENHNQFKFNNITLSLKKSEHGIFTTKPQIELVIAFPKEETNFCKELLALIKLTKEERKALKVEKQYKTAAVLEDKFLGIYEMEYEPNEKLGHKIFITPYYNTPDEGYKDLKSKMEKCSGLKFVFNNGYDEIVYSYKDVTITISKTYLGNGVEIKYKN